MPEEVAEALDKGRRAVGRSENPVRRAVVLWELSDPPDLKRVNLFAEICGDGDSPPAPSVPPAM